MHLRDQAQRNAATAKILALAGLSRTVTAAGIYRAGERSPVYGPRTSGVQDPLVTAERLALIVHGSSASQLAMEVDVAADLLNVPASVLLAFCELIALVKTGNFDGIDTWIAA